MVKNNTSIVHDRYNIVDFTQADVQEDNQIYPTMTYYFRNEYIIWQQLILDMTFTDANIFDICVATVTVYCL
jgi:hypothetical protein